MLTDVLNAVLGSTAKVRILRAVLPLTSPVSGREARELAGVRSQSGAQQALGQLAQLGILAEERIRGARLYRVNRQHHLHPCICALFEAEQQRVSLLRDLVKQELESKGLLSSVHFVVLFGSVARGDARPDSDVDLLVVTGTARTNARVDGALQAVAERAEHTLGVRLSPLVMALPRLRRRYRSGDPLLHNIAAEGRVLLGSSLREMVGTG
ncbi:MAG TPA: nucleotidyltransferase domain-containing protein [Longimicrobium sp.]|nr:nucleotidyltransferase domain-containing protein [Longimicrobium sp.]